LKYAVQRKDELGQKKIIQQALYDTIKAQISFAGSRTVSDPAASQSKSLIILTKD
jgi:hypothetical protein